MLYIVLTILSSLTIALILKLNESREGDRMVVAGANYVTASILGVLTTDGEIMLPLQWLGFALLLGGGFAAAFLLLMRTIRVAGLAVTGSVARTATIGPILLSVLIYDERPDLLRVIGILLGLTAFVLLGLSQRNKQSPESHHRLHALFLLTLLFLVMTVNDFGMKAAQVNDIDEGTLLFFLFGTAAVICWSIILAGRFGRGRTSRRTLRSGDLLLGGILGVPNCLSSWFLIRGLQEVPASVAFPIVSAGGVIAVTLAAVIVWKEEISRPARIGIGLAALAVALLGM